MRSYNLFKLYDLIIRIIFIINIINQFLLLSSNFFFFYLKGVEGHFSMKYIICFVKKKNLLLIFFSLVMLYFQL